MLDAPIYFADAIYEHFLTSCSPSYITVTARRKEILHLISSALHSLGVESNHTKYGDKLLQYCCDVHFAKQHTIYMMQANLLWIFLAQNMMHYQQYDFSFLENFGTCNRRCCWLQLDIQMATTIADHYFLFFPITTFLGSVPASIRDFVKWCGM